MTPKHFFIGDAQRSGTTYTYHLCAETMPEIEMAHPVKPDTEILYESCLGVTGALPIATPSLLSVTKQAHPCTVKKARVILKSNMQHNKLRHISLMPNSSLFCGIPWSVPSLRTASFESQKRL
jgi:hypothetical protein